MSRQRNSRSDCGRDDGSNPELQLSKTPAWGWHIPAEAGPSPGEWARCGSRCWRWMTWSVSSPGRMKVLIVENRRCQPPVHENTWRYVTCYVLLPLKVVESRSGDQASATGPQ